MNVTQIPDSARVGLARHSQQHLQLQGHLLGGDRSHLQGQHCVSARQAGAETGQHESDLCGLPRDTDTAYH